MLNKDNQISDCVLKYIVTALQFHHIRNHVFFNLRILLLYKDLNIMKNIDVTDKMLFLINTNKLPDYPFYLVHIGSLVNQHPCIRPNGLPDYQFLYCVAGEGQFTVDEREYHITAGMGVLLKPDVAHEYHAIKEPWSTYWVRFSGAGCDMLPQLASFTTHKLFYIRSFDRLMYLFNALYTAAEQSGLLNNNEVALHLYHFLLEYPECICDNRENSNPHDTKAVQLSKVIAYIEEHYPNDIPLTTLAGIAQMSPQHLCRLFKKTYHLRPVEYITSYRISKAKNLLLSSKEMTLKEIASSTGFNDLSYFCSIFKKSEGVTPSEFRGMQK